MRTFLECSLPAVHCCGNKSLAVHAMYTARMLCRAVGAASYVYHARSTLAQRACSLLRMGDCHMTVQPHLLGYMRA